MATQKTKTEPDAGMGPLRARIHGAILELVGRVPESSHGAISEPAPLAQYLIAQASTKAAVVSGGMALPPGMLGLLSVIPDMFFMWRIQAQLVSDIAAVYGKRAELTSESLMYCLFRHFAAQAVRGLAVQTGTRIIVRRATMDAMRQAADTVSWRIAQRLVHGSFVRWLPIIGAAAVAAYACYDTRQVGKNAVELFKSPPRPDPARPEAR
jgi:hypothetical protein